jgi:hypothetical protein
VTRASLREYAAVQRERYRHATRAEKRQLSDEVLAVAGIHRKAAIRLLRRAPRPRARRAPVRLRPRSGRRRWAGGAEETRRRPGEAADQPSLAKLKAQGPLGGICPTVLA